METLEKSSIELLYNFAYNHYKQGKYGEAVGLFRLLTMADIRSRKHWMGLGASLQFQKKYAEAIEAYHMAAALDPADVHVHIYAADCFFAQDMHKKGISALDCAEQALKSKKKPDQNLLAHIKLMRQGWNK